MSNQIDSIKKYVFKLSVEGKSAKSGILKVEGEVICVRLIGMHFDTNKNFLLPDAMKGIQKLVDIYKEHPDSEILVVGHTDRFGQPSQNDPISLERADAVAAFLTDDVDAWLGRYEMSVVKNENKLWGWVEDFHMLESLPDFSTKPKTQNTVRWFQETRELKVDGSAGPETRRQLITEYMAHDKTTLPAGIEMVTHGCGENFPLDDAGEIDTDAPDGEHDEQDRRVEIFVFDPPGIKPKPPRKNSKKGSKEYPEWMERSKEKHDFRTGLMVLRLRILDSRDEPRSSLDYVLEVDGQQIKDKTDSKGIIEKRIPFNAKTATLKFDDESIELLVQNKLAPIEKDLGVEQRLANLGFLHEKPSGEMNFSAQQALMEFQARHDLAITGEIDNETREILQHVHGS